MLSKEASSTIFWVFGMTWPGIEPRSPGSLANTLTIMPMSGGVEMPINKYTKLNQTKCFDLLYYIPRIFNDIFNNFLIDVTNEKKKGVKKKQKRRKCKYKRTMYAIP